MRALIGAALAMAVWSLPAYAHDIGAADAVALTVASAAETEAAEERVADPNIRGLRRSVERLSSAAASGRAAPVELTAAYEQLVAQLAARDADYARFAAGFRAQVETIAATAEGRALLAQRRPGGLRTQRALLRELAATHAVSPRALAAIALDDRARGEAASEEVIALYADAIGPDPGASSDWLDLSRLHADVGDLPAAHRAAERAAEIADDEQDRLAALHQLGDTLVAEGDLVSARARFEQSLAIAQRLAAADARSAQLQRSISVRLIRIGDVLLAQGDLAGARARYDESLAIVRRLAAADTIERLTAAGPSPARLQRDVSVSLGKIGDVLLYEGDCAGARARFEESLAIAQRLAAANPASAALQRDVWLSLWRLQRFPESGVTWARVAAAMEGMDRGGVLAGADRRWLEQARANAAHERSMPLSAVRQSHTLPAA